MLRLGDLGRPVMASRTPAEVAADVDQSMEPLAAVYGKALYGPPGEIAPEDVARAEEALHEARVHLAATTSRTGRLRSWYRTTSLRRPARAGRAR